MVVKFQVARLAFLALAAVALARPAPASAQPSGVQITPDGLYNLVSKDVGAERWAITRNDDGTITGNVFFPDGGDPKFVWCEEQSSTEEDITLVCSGADRCTLETCTPDDWAFIAEVTLPFSFFTPDPVAASAFAASMASPAGIPSGSGLQITPDELRVLVSKDVGAERWAITRNLSDGSVTGNVFFPDGGDPKFLWCQQLDEADGILTYRCFGADRCDGECTPDSWTEIAVVELPESFFQLRKGEITPENVATLVEKWDHPSGAVTSEPVLANGLLYVTSWDAKIYALDPETGAERWVFDTGVAGFGIEATPKVLDDGDVIFGDWLTNLYRLDGATGDVVWERLLGDPAVDHIWSAVGIADGRIFVGIASHTDNPCTNGRTIAVDLESGDVLWEVQNVPDKICDSDTAIACEDDSDCDGGTCVEARGAGVTAEPRPDEDGEFVYVNAVGCYTFPSVGNSDSVMKLDAETGDIEWLTRVTPPEQFGFCADDSSIDCAPGTTCESGAPCQRKGAYHDFGFLNGPLLIDTVDSRGRDQTLVISGSKDGALYAFDEEDGDIVWENRIVPLPVTPGFAGFGLFNGALEYDGERIYAALYQTIPDLDPELQRLMAFDPSDGSMIWGADIGVSWAHASEANGVVYAGAREGSSLYAHDADTGERLAAIPLPLENVSKALVVGNTLFVGYGVASPGEGGVIAFTLP
jgi:outer membrane protein assembly factor BamB